MEYRKVTVMPGSQLYAALKDKDNAKAELIWKEMLAREKVMLESATRAEKKYWSDRWNQTEEKLAEIRNTWMVLSEQQPSVKSPEWKVWDERMKREVREPSIEIHNLRIKLLMKRP